MMTVHPITQERSVSTGGETGQRHCGCADKDECPFASCLVEETLLEKTLSAIRVHTCGREQLWICVSTYGVCVCVRT